MCLLLYSFKPVSLLVKKKTSVTKRNAWLIINFMPIVTSAFLISEARVAAATTINRTVEERMKMEGNKSDARPVDTAAADGRWR